MNASKPRGSILYLPHGGGPMPLLGDPAHQALVDFLKTVHQQLIRPAAILLVSAHWECPQASITAGANPQLIYDYYNFPDAAYKIEYPAAGNPALAEQIHTLLGESLINNRLDAQRGFDHGLFVPLKLMFPDADIPCVQLSMLDSLNPQQHIELGIALQKLKQQDVLVIGSGLSFHNLPEFFKQAGPTLDLKNEAFHDWLNQTCVDQSLSEAQRQQRLIRWEDAPHARYCHPREEHLLPLHVCYGAATSPARCIFDDNILNKRSTAYLW